MCPPSTSLTQDWLDFTNNLRFPLRSGMPSGNIATLGMCIRECAGWQNMAKKKKMWAKAVNMLAHDCCFIRPAAQAGRRIPCCILLCQIYDRHSHQVQQCHVFGGSRGPGLFWLRLNESKKGTDILSPGVLILRGVSLVEV